MFEIVLLYIADPIQALHSLQAAKRSDQRHRHPLNKSPRTKNEDQTQRRLRHRSAKADGNSRHKFTSHGIISPSSSSSDSGPSDVKVPPSGTSTPTSHGLASHQEGSYGAPVTAHDTQAPTQLSRSQPHSAQPPTKRQLPRQDQQNLSSQRPQPLLLSYSATPTIEGEGSKIPAAFQQPAMDEARSQSFVFGEQAHSQQGTHDMRQL